jgi:hypothetical protein
VLDRAISLGSKKRFSAPEPFETDHLPASDESWVCSAIRLDSCRSNLITQELANTSRKDNGDLIRAVYRPISTPFSESVGPFARLCQASLLVSRVTNHCNDTIRLHSVNSPTPFVLADVLSLGETLASFANLIATELSSTPQAFFSLTAAQSLVRSALIMLLDTYACPETLRDGPAGNVSALDGTLPRSDDEVAMQAHAIEGLQKTARAICDSGIEMLEVIMLPAELRRASPLCFDSLYGALATLYWMYKETGDEASKMAVTDVKRTLSSLGMRWRLAKRYVDIMSHHDVTTSPGRKSAVC